MKRPALIWFTLAASACAADPLLISFPEPSPVGFAGAELAIPVRLENRGAAAIDAKFSTRLWQMSSATLVPLGEAVPWWSGRIEAGKTAEALAKVTLPDFRTATRLRLQVLAADGVPAGKVDLIALPRDWLRGEIASLPAPPALYDPAHRLAPAFTALGIALDSVADLENVRAGLVILVSSKEQMESLTTETQRLAARGVGVIFLPPEIDLEKSARDQFQFVQNVREALKRKQPPPTANP